MNDIYEQLERIKRHPRANSGRVGRAQRAAYDYDYAIRGTDNYRWTLAKMDGARADFDPERTRYYRNDINNHRYPRDVYTDRGPELAFATRMYAAKYDKPFKRKLPYPLVGPRSKWKSYNEVERQADRLYDEVKKRYMNDPRKRKRGERIIDRLYEILGRYQDNMVDNQHPDDDENGDFKYPKEIYMGVRTAMGAGQ